MCCSCLDIFFFKQKTAYEMRISDWSSDVCSSDLPMFLYGHQGLNRPVYDDVRKLRALANDLEAISDGILPTRWALASAPSLGRYQIRTRPHYCLTGYVSGHPEVEGPGAITSDLWVFAPDRKSTRLNSSH